MSRFLDYVQYYTRDTDTSSKPEYHICQNEIPLGFLALCNAISSHANTIRTCFHNQDDSSSVDRGTYSPCPSTTIPDSRIRSLRFIVITCAVIPLASHLSAPQALPPLPLLLFLVRRYEAMNRPMIHNPLLIIALPKLFGLRPLIPIELAMTFTPRTLLTGLITIGLHPTSRASTAVNPTGEGFSE